MTDTDPLARIDAALDPTRPLTETSETRGEVIPILLAARAEIVRLSALIPEPPTDDERESIADEISGIQVGAGYESVTIGIAAALEAADAILASPVWRNRGLGPITDEIVDAACEAWAAEPLSRPGEESSDAGRRYMRAALEAAEAARDAEVGR